METERTRRVAERDLRSFVQVVFEAAGLARRDAGIVTDSLVASDLRGTHSHGVIRTPFLVDRLQKGGANAHAAPTVLQESPATALLDGDRALGAITAARAMDIAIAKAREQGIGMVSARNSDFIGACAHYALMAPPQDMIGIAWTNGFPGMTAWGSRQNAIGNNPIAFAAPSASRGPIALDMALSVAAGGRIRVAAKKGEKIPGDWLIDRDGVATDDPNALTAGGALLPLGYKGFGLAVFGEILCGALTGARMLSEIPAWHKDTDAAIGNGHVHIAIDIARFVEPHAFKERVDALVDALKEAPRMPDVDSILMPGERAWRTHQANQRDGIPVPDAVAADLRALAEKLGVELPQGLAASDVTYRELQ
jgi:LDH2 family malate/lactate/ureidoglycolate dehydrogenase